MLLQLSAWIFAQLLLQLSDSKGTGLVLQHVQLICGPVVVLENVRASVILTSDSRLLKTNVFKYAPLSPIFMEIRMAITALQFVLLVNSLIQTTDYARLAVYHYSNTTSDALRYVLMASMQIWLEIV